MKAQGQTEAYIVAEGGRLAGKITVHDAIEAGENSAFRHADSSPTTLFADDSLADAMHTVSDFVGESVPVITRESRQFIGAVTEGDLFQAIIAVQSDVRHRERD